jgi:hypothetical protein
MHISLPAVSSTGKVVLTMLRMAPTTEQQSEEQQAFCHTTVVAVANV